MEILLITIIVGIVVALSVRSLYRTLSGKKSGCCCSGSKKNCSASSSCGSHSNGHSD